LSDYSILKPIQVLEHDIPSSETSTILLLLHDDSVILISILLDREPRYLCSLTAVAAPAGTAWAEVLVAGSHSPAGDTHRPGEGRRIAGGTEDPGCSIAGWTYREESLQFATFADLGYERPSRGYNDDEEESRRGS
jgi:hypothetical protein